MAFEDTVILTMDDNGSEISKNKADDRGKWGSPIEFILSCLGYAVGLGNVWRFPFLCYKNGGGAFLIPYFLMLTFVGIPVFLIELTVGQFSQSGPATVWDVSPMFVGVGWGMIMISTIGSIYYNLIITWSMYYMFASFQSVLPWTSCSHDYNTEFCWPAIEAKDCEKSNSSVFFNNECYNETELYENDTLKAMYELSKDRERVSSSHEYFYYNVLSISSGIGDTGYMKWDITLVLLLAWIICYLCVFKGIHSTGKVVYFTATFPYVMLVILFFKSILLKGAGEGVVFYLYPKFETLLKPVVWADAAGQIFFSLSVGTGGLMTFASYNKFNNNIYRDTLIVAISNCLTSFFAGFVVFSAIGFLAHEEGKKVEDVVQSGSGLAFLVYPEILARLPFPQIWSFLFFFMLLTLGLDSQFAGLENIQTAFTDVFPILRRYKWAVSGIVCILGFLLGLTQCTQAGYYWEELMSYYSSGFSLIIMGFVEVLVFGWIYGADRLIKDIETMCGVQLKRHWYYCWKFVSPIILMIILIMSFLEFTPLEVYDKELPGWAIGLGWCMALVSVVFIPVGAIFVLVRNEDFWNTLKRASKPNSTWESYSSNSPPSQSVENLSIALNNSKRASYTNPAFSQSVMDINSNL